MMTYEMVGVADQNGKTYESKYGTYSKEKGFHVCCSKGADDLVNALFHENCWSLKQEVKQMTKEDIEKELGYKIKIVPDKNEKSNKTDNISDIDHFFDVLKRAGF